MKMRNETHIENLPFVSIIVPFRNNFDEVLEIQKKLVSQTYPKEKFETLFIDNGSLKRQKLTLYDGYGFQLMQEDHFKNSPYSARNKGIDAAKGEIIVFIDANSYPEPDWLEQGVNHLKLTQAELVAGHVRFDYGKRVTAAMVADSITSIKMKEAVEHRNVAYTANLFVKKRVFDLIGKFEEGVRSGGDVRFTGRASSKGFQIQFCRNAVVSKKSRRCMELYRKKIRTGRGYFYTWKDEVDKPVWFYNFLRSLIPPSFPKKDSIYPGVNRFVLWSHLYLTSIIEQISFMLEYLRYTLGGERDLDRSKKSNLKS